MSAREAAQARALLTALRGFSEKAGHDLAGPLNQASSLIGLFIKRYRNQMDADADQLLDYLLNSAERMESAARGVRAFMEIAGTPASAEIVDLNEVLATARECLSRDIAESGAAIVSEPLPVVCGDARQLTAVFENLIGNSLKFRDAAEKPRVDISTRRVGGMHEIAIRDEGIGIEAADAWSLFVAFKRLNGREYPGPGLGLAMVRMMVEMHGGEVTIEPAAAGACVRFTLPPPQP